MLSVIHESCIPQALFRDLLRFWALPFCFLVHCPYLGEKYYFNSFIFNVNVFCYLAVTATNNLILNSLTFSFS